MAGSPGCSLSGAAAGLLKPVDAPPQLIHLPLAGQAQVLQQLIAVAPHLAFRLFLQLGRFAAQGLASTSSTRAEA